MTPEKKLEDLKNRLQEVSAINSAAAVLNWDMSTYMPEGGAPARGRSMAVLQTIAHEKFTDKAIGNLLDDLQAYGESLPYDDDDAALLRVTRRDYERAVRVPSAELGAFIEHSTHLYNLWTQARPENDFEKVREPLEKTLDFSRAYANYFPGYDHIADPLIDMSDYGMKAASVRAVFAELREKLVPIVKAITTQEPADDSAIRQFFPEQKQWDYGLKIAGDYGYDFKRGRQDKTHHPFMTSFSIGDVRITTRFREDDLGDGLFSTLHETGHALYEQGINPAYEGLPLADGTSAGVHESQSRMWENIVGRSRGFWEHYYPSLQAQFPEQLGNVSLDSFYRAINKVTPSLIRTDADEVTYNLHVMIRFDLELQLLEGTLNVRDLPEAWDARYESDLGIRAPEIKNGVLQDVHWFGGFIGGSFQGYTLGNLLSAQFYQAALKAHPEIPSQIAQGQFGTLHTWLKTNIYQYGSKYTTNELLERIVGTELQTQPLIDYLREKYGALYSL